MIMRPHPRARRLRLRFDPQRSALVLTMPVRASRTAAIDWVEAQSAWISKQLSSHVTLCPVTAGTQLPWGDGALLIDWSVLYPRKAALVGDRLAIGGSEQSVGPRTGRWLRARALVDFTARTHKLAERAGLSCSGVGVGDPRLRWGSCNRSGHIRYSWRLIMAPDFVRQALVAHEVAHLAHMNHGPDFHALATRLAGDDGARSRAWLKAKGRDLHRWRFSPA